MEQQTPIKFEVITQKEDVLSSTFISSETAQLLKVYIPTLSKENPYLFPSNGKRHLKDEAINKMLKKLLAQAKIKVPRNKRFTFHGLRKRFLSTAYTLGIDNEIAKLLVGKSIGKAMETYLEDVNLKNAFMEIREQTLSLSNSKAKSEVEMKDLEIAKLKRENEQLKLQMKGFAHLFSEEIMKKLEDQMKTKGLLQLKDSTETTTEDVLGILEKIGKDRETQKREYDKMLAETNGFNHKK